MTAGWDGHGPRGNRNPKARGLNKTIKNQKKDKGPACLGIFGAFMLLAGAGVYGLVDLIRGWMS
jgi:hypothetical protein